MAKNFNLGVSALSQLGSSKLDEVEDVLDAARAWLRNQIDESRRGINELFPPAKRQRVCRGANKAVPIEYIDKVRAQSLKSDDQSI